MYRAPGENKVTHIQESSLKQAMSSASLEELSTARAVTEVYENDLYSLAIPPPPYHPFTSFTSNLNN